MLKLLLQHMSAYLSWHGQLVEPCESAGASMHNPTVWGQKTNHVTQKEWVRLLVPTEQVEG